MWIVWPRTPLVPPLVRLDLSLPDGEEIETNWTQPLAYSPDGSQLMLNSPEGITERPGPVTHRSEQANG